MPEQWNGGSEEAERGGCDISKRGASYFVSWRVFDVHFVRGIRIVEFWTCWIVASRRWAVDRPFMLTTCDVGCGFSQMPHGRFWL